MSELSALPKWLFFYMETLECCARCALQGVYESCMVTSSPIVVTTAMM